MEVRAPGLPAQSSDCSPRTHGAQPVAVLRLALPDGSPRTHGAQPVAVLRLALRPGGGVGKGSEASLRLSPRGPAALRIAVLSSTPLNPLEGSGTFVGIDGLRRGLTRLGHTFELRPLRLRTGFHTLDRWLYNATVALRPPRGVDLVYGVDLDGFLWARRRRVLFVVSLKGIIADELKNERGWVRALLAIQARWERLNARRADVVIVSSRYSAGVAHAAYGLDPSVLTVVPEPIDLEGWTARFAAAQRRPRAGPT